VMVGAVVAKAGFEIAGVTVFTFGVELAFAVELMAALISACFCATTFCSKLIADSDSAGVDLTGPAVSLNIQR